MIVAVVLSLVSALATLNAMTVRLTQSQIEVGRGDDLRLECQYTSTTTNRNNFNIEWIRLEDKPQEELIDVVQYFSGGMYRPGDQYLDRANFTGDVEKDDCSIVIKRVQMTDSGTYVVEVKTPFDLEGNRKESVEVMVLVPPSPPVCVIEGKAEYGQTVKLTCHSKEGSPAPVYSWKSYSPQNQERQLPQTSIEEKGGLILKNISATSSGFFICTSRNKIRATTCNITLAVMPPSMNIGFYGGIIGGAVGALIVLGIIVYCCCCRDDEKIPEDYEMEDPHHAEEEEPPESDSRRNDYRGAYHDDDPNENDGRSSPHSVRAPLAPPNKPRYAPENYEV
ncbi:cell surface A33 antigen-like [Pristis pectinata]|uniref:cell surface A33 antigen-like n=1 Tax=Pristis pectinata TaxID=685728 RepID=UPI00223E7905|nr:cell surface A33 antigen-like [Pristis pectinata]